MKVEESTNTQANDADSHVSNEIAELGVEITLAKPEDLSITSTSVPGHAPYLKLKAYQNPLWKGN
jgi:hypothetical protein